MRAGGAVQAGERPTRLAHQDVEGREIPYRYLRLGGDVGRALGHQAIGQEVAVGALRTAGGMLANPWLFPSRRPGKHLDAISLVIGLGNAGINVLGARNSALRNLVAEMPLPSWPTCWATATAAPSATPNWRVNPGRVHHVVVANQRSKASDGVAEPR